MTPEQTKQFIDLCLEHGISKLRVGDPKGGELSLEFFEKHVKPIVLTQTVKETPALDKSPKSKEPHRGDDGLTAEEQLDLYGRVIDAEE